MTRTNSKLRKAAVLLRSVDADTAAALLAQLSSAEAASLREAIRSLGPIDPDEQAEVVAEFRRESPLANEQAGSGVELTISSLNDGNASENVSQPVGAGGKRFHFLEHAQPGTIASYLSREHAQTVAVVLSHLAPSAAAGVLAALPKKLQLDAMERLSLLGETDSDSVAVLERELEAWVAKRGNAGIRSRRQDAVASILAAADATTREALLTNLTTHKSPLASQFAPARDKCTPSRRRPPVDEYRAAASRSVYETERHQRNNSPSPQPPIPRPQHRIAFDQLTHLDGPTLAKLLGAADPNVLALALAGSRDELVDRICEQMPKRTAKMFRRELRRLGPTRLSDVEAAQRSVAELASQQLAERHARMDFSLA
jgi:flagellar motor switch protein FliG